METVRIHDADLARRVRQIRIDLYGGSELPQLAEALGIPAGTWENYEAGVRMPATTLLAFIALTRVSPRWLVTGKGLKFDGH